MLVGELTELEAGLYGMDNLRYNGYFLHEEKAPDGFIKDDNYYYFEIRNDGEIVTVEKHRRKTVPYPAENTKTILRRAEIGR